MLKDFYERKKLEKLLKNNTIMGDFSDFTKYSPTYLATNEKHRNVLKVVDVKDKDILCLPIYLTPFIAQKENESLD